MVNIRFGAAGATKADVSAPKAADKHVVWRHTRVQKGVTVGRGGSAGLKDGHPVLAGWLGAGWLVGCGPVVLAGQPLSWIITPSLLPPPPLA